MASYRMLCCHICVSFSFLRVVLNALTSGGRRLAFLAVKKYMSVNGQLEETKAAYISGKDKQKYELTEITKWWKLN